ncbi:MAG TPA: translation initiation factor IF-2, partial [Flavobacterium sp.]|nr:translation initiation factor IF-2 [Flavobacterium sp.]
MSEERTIRINKVLREFNISLDRAVDHLKEKGIAIESNPNAKISDNEYNLLQLQFAGDKGKKVASLEVSEEKRKEKEALRLERERELEAQRRQEEERQQQEVIRAKASVSGLKQVGTIDLEPKKAAPEPAKPEPAMPEAEKPEPVKSAPKPTEVPVVKQPEPAKEPEKSAEPQPDKPAEHKTNYTVLEGTKSTGQVIDLSQFAARKKKEEPGDSVKGKRKRIPGKPGDSRPGTPGQNRPGQSQGNRPARPGKPGSRPAVAAKVEPTEEEVKNQIRETLEKLQGKGGKSKAAKYRRDKRDTHRQKSEDEQRSLEEGSKILKVTEFVTVGEIATMMDVPITKVIGTCMSLGI